jgi:hypothetical protein
LEITNLDGIAHDFGGGTDTRGLGRGFAFIRVLGRCLLSYELVRSSVFFPDKKKGLEAAFFSKKKKVRSSVFDRM